jgi:hypothetical protein
MPDAVKAGMDKDEADQDETDEDEADKVKQIR